MKKQQQKKQSILLANLKNTELFLLSKSPPSATHLALG